MIPIALWRLLTIIAAILVGLCSVPFWVYLKFAADQDNWVNVALYVISGVVLIIVAIIGLIGVFKKARFLLLIFIIVMILMVIFVLIQLIIFFVNYHTCDIDEKVISDLFPCDFNIGAYLAPTIIILIIFVVAAFVAIMLRRAYSDDQGSGSYY